MMFIFILFIFNEVSTDAFMTTEALAETSSSNDSKQIELFVTFKSDDFLDANVDFDQSTGTIVQCPRCNRHGRHTLVYKGKN